MRFRRLTPTARSRFLASGLFLIGLSSTASLLSSDLETEVVPGHVSGKEIHQVTLPAEPRAALAAEVTPISKRIDDCPSAG